MTDEKRKWCGKPLNGKGINMIKSVTATVTIEIFVNCPNCPHHFDVETQDAENDKELMGAIFKNTDESMKGVHSYFVCPSCNNEFIVNNLEY